MKSPQQQKLWTATITPFDDEGQIDYNSFEAHLRRQEEAGNGIVLFGTTGEGGALNDGERKAIIDWICDLQLAVPIMVGVGAGHQQALIDWVQWCNDRPIDAFLMINPPYVKAGPKGLEAWFRALLDVAHRPVMLYNHPFRTGSTLHPETVAALADHPRLWALKDCSGGVEMPTKYLEAAPDMTVYSGDDQLIPFQAVAGCSGLVSICANVWPEATQEYLSCCLGGRTRGVMPHWPEACQELCCATNPIPVKALLCMKGMISSDYVRPPLSRDDLPTDNRLRERDARIDMVGV